MCQIFHLQIFTCIQRGTWLSHLFWNESFSLLRLNLKLGHNGHHFRSDAFISTFTEAIVEKWEETRSWWKKWQVSDRCLQDQEVGEVGDGGGTLASEEQSSATGEKVPNKTADAPLMALAGRGDTGERRSGAVVEEGRGSRLFTAASLLLSNKFTQKALWEYAFCFCKHALVSINVWSLSRQRKMYFSKLFIFLVYFKESLNAPILICQYLKK